ncbi:MAG: M24 family metallopeptidase [Marinilabiliales bacterium]|nr:M24 family metallopeptidase [Marinilabiliales bacterium]
MRQYAAGAHTLFMPHGLGHMMGLDVHDMESLGENYVGYNDEVKRSDQFGSAYLRFALPYKPGHVLTVEPGCYFIPELIERWKSEGKYRDFINYGKLDSYMSIGGIRLEDNVLITDNGHKVLGKPIPKSIKDVKPFVCSPFSRLGICNRGQLKQLARITSRRHGTAPADFTDVHNPF